MKGAQTNVVPACLPQLNMGANDAHDVGLRPNCLDDIVGNSQSLRQCPNLQLLQRNGLYIYP